MCAGGQVYENILILVDIQDNGCCHVCLVKLLYEEVQWE